MIVWNYFVQINKISNRHVMVDVIICYNYCETTDKIQLTLVQLSIACSHRKICDLQMLEVFAKQRALLRCWCIG